MKLKDEPLYDRKRLLTALAERLIEHANELGFKIRVRRSATKSVPFKTANLIFETLTALILLALAALDLPAAANPFEQRLAWTPSESTNISVYVLHVSTNGPANTNWTRVAVTNANWVNLESAITNGFLKTYFTPGVTNWLTLTARDANGVESEPSNVIQFVPPKPPRVLRLTVQIAPELNGPWTNLPEPFTVPMLADKMFTRLKHE